MRNINNQKKISAGRTSSAGESQNGTTTTSASSSKQDDVLDWFLAAVLSGIVAVFVAWRILFVPDHIEPPTRPLALPSSREEEEEAIEPPALLSGREDQEEEAMEDPVSVSVVRAPLPPACSVSVAQKAETAAALREFYAAALQRMDDDQGSVSDDGLYTIAEEDSDDVRSHEAFRCPSLPSSTASPATMRRPLTKNNTIPEVVVSPVESSVARPFRDSATLEDCTDKLAFSCLQLALDDIRKGKQHHTPSHVDAYVTVQAHVSNSAQCTFARTASSTAQLHVAPATKLDQSSADPTCSIGHTADSCLSAAIASSSASVSSNNNIDQAAASLTCFHSTTPHNDNTTVTVESQSLTACKATTPLIVASTVAAGSTPISVVTSTASSQNDRFLQVYNDYFTNASESDSPDPAASSVMDIDLERSQRRLLNYSRVYRDALRSGLEEFDAELKDQQPENGFDPPPLLVSPSTGSQAIIDNFNGQAQRMNRATEPDSIYKASRTAGVLPISGSGRVWQPTTTDLLEAHGESKLREGFSDSDLSQSLAELGSAVEVDPNEPSPSTTPLLPAKPIEPAPLVTLTAASTSSDRDELQASHVLDRSIEHRGGASLQQPRDTTQRDTYLQLDEELLLQQGSNKACCRICLLPTVYCCCNKELTSSPQAQHTSQDANYTAPTPTSGMPTTGWTRTEHGSSSVVTKVEKYQKYERYETRETTFPPVGRSLHDLNVRSIQNQLDSFPVGVSSPRPELSRSSERIVYTKVENSEAQPATSTYAHSQKPQVQQPASGVIDRYGKPTDRSWKATTTSSKPTPMEYSTKPTAMEYSAKPTAMEYSAKPKSMEYSTKPTPMEYSTKPKSMEYSTKHTAMEYSNKPTAMEYSAKPTPMEYSTPAPVPLQRSDLKRQSAPSPRSRPSGAPTPKSVRVTGREEPTAQRIQPVQAKQEQPRHHSVKPSYFLSSDQLSKLVDDPYYVKQRSRDALHKPQTGRHTDRPTDRPTGRPSDRPPARPLPLSEKNLSLWSSMPDNKLTGEQKLQKWRNSINMTEAEAQEQLDKPTQVFAAPTPVKSIPISEKSSRPSSRNFSKAERDREVHKLIDYLHRSNPTLYSTDQRGNFERASKRSSKYRVRMERAKRDFIENNASVSDLYKTPKEFEDKFKVSLENIMRKPQPPRGPLLEPLRDEIRKSQVDIRYRPIRPKYVVPQALYDDEYERIVNRAERLYTSYASRMSRVKDSLYRTSKAISTGILDADQLPSEDEEEDPYIDVERSRARVRSGRPDGERDSSRARSIDYHLDRRHELEPPENQLQKVLGDLPPNRAPTEEELRFRKSTDKLSMPRWYTDSEYCPGGKPDFLQGPPGARQSSRSITSTAYTPMTDYGRATPATTYSAYSRPESRSTAIGGGDYEIQDALQHSRDTTYVSPWATGGRVTGGGGAGGGRGGSVRVPRSRSAINADGTTDFLNDFVSKNKNELNELWRSRTSLKSQSRPDLSTTPTPQNPPQHSIPVATVRPRLGGVSPPTSQMSQSSDIRRPTTLSMTAKPQPAPRMGTTTLDKSYQEPSPVQYGTYSVGPAPFGPNDPRSRTSRVIEVADIYNDARSDVGSTASKQRPLASHVTLEEVLDSLLGLPSRTSANGSLFDDSASMNYDSMPDTPLGGSRVFNPPTADPLPKTSVFTQNAYAMERAAASPQKARDYLQNERLFVRCERCNRTAEAQAARQAFVTCHNCYTYYCGRSCRNAHWSSHKSMCNFARINTVCKEVILKVRSDPVAQWHMSQVARTGHKTRGRGSVNFWFRAPDLAHAYLRGGWAELNSTPGNYLYYYSINDLEENRKDRHLIRTCHAYNPQAKFVLSVSVITDVDHCPSTPPTPHTRMTPRSVSRQSNGRQTDRQAGRQTNNGYSTMPATPVITDTKTLLKNVMKSIENISGNDYIDQPKAGAVAPFVRGHSQQRHTLSGDRRQNNRTWNKGSTNTLV